MFLTELAEWPKAFLKCIRELTYSSQSQHILENIKSLPPRLRKQNRHQQHLLSTANSAQCLSGIEETTPFQGNLGGLISRAFPSTGRCHPKGPSFLWTASFEAQFETSCTHFTSLHLHARVCQNKWKYKSPRRVDEVHTNCPGAQHIGRQENAFVLPRQYYTLNITI